jgi:hypothetical protein
MNHTVTAFAIPDTADARAEARLEREGRHQDLTLDALAGCGDFWQGYGGKYNNEQEIPIFRAVRYAQMCVGASDAERWRIVQDAVLRGIDEYATWMSEEL